jgi:peptide/nickel transport system permease protein
MGRYLIRRVLGAIPLLLGIVTLLFVALSLAPGDPTAYYVTPGVPPEVREQLRQNLGLDQPLPIRYVKWLNAFARGDFGYSFGQGRPVAEVLRDALPNTLTLAGASLGLIFLSGVTVGALQAVRQHGWVDRILSMGSLFFYSMPAFWLALMLVLIFSLKAYQWGWPLAFPATGVTSVDYEFLSTGGKILDRIRHLVLPVTTVTLVSAAGIARYTRGQMLEVIRQDYVRTARAKGLRERTVVIRHVLRNSLIPVVTLLGLSLPILFSGTVFTETIFAWPGMGRTIVDAIFQRDYPVVLAASFFFAVMVVIGNLIADLLYAVVDPRIRHG